MASLVTAKNTTVTAKVRIIPVKMVTPNARGIYAPSRIGRAFYTDQANLDAIANCSQTILVSLEPDGVSNPQPVKAYGYKMRCWYIVG